MVETLNKNTFPYYLFITPLTDFSRFVANAYNKNESKTHEFLDEELTKLKQINEQLEGLNNIYNQKKIKMLFNKCKVLKSFDKERYITLKYMVEILLNSYDFLMSQPSSINVRIEYEKAFKFVQKLHLLIVEIINIYDAMVESVDEEFLKSLEQGYKEDFEEDLNFNKSWESTDLEAFKKFYIEDID